MQVFQKGINRFLIALQFLTILPIKIKGIKEGDFGRALLYFPIVGVLIGIVLAIGLFLSPFLPNLVLASLILVLSIVITGGIHIDGFADTCDGFYGNREKEKVLEIMRDSHIGTMGVIGLISLLLLKFSLFVSIPENLLWKGLILMGGFSRWSQGLACLISSYPKKEGKGKFFVEYARKGDIIIGGLIVFTLFLSVARLKGLLVFFLSLLSVFLFIEYAKRRIGGMTGDTIGAASEIGEISVLFFFSL